MLFSLILLMFSILTTPMFAQLRPYPSGIKVSFIEKKMIGKNDYIIQMSEETNPKKASRFLRVINSLKDIPADQDLGIVFYDEDGEEISHIVIEDSEKPSPDFVFFIDRNTGNFFQGKKDIYAFPKKASHFSVGLINKKGDMIKALRIPEFDSQNKLAIEYLKKFDKAQSYMWQIEVTGTVAQNLNRLNVFYFTR
ncbi:MAG: hypothetical protein ACRCS8_06230 [Brevinema sp.]